jgi:TonB-linked SusC/RagA family outer membrane protein
MVRTTFSTLRIAGVIVALLAASAGAAQAQRGEVRGTVRDAETGQPIAQAHVTVGGAAVGALTDDSGQYHLANVLAGVRVVRVRIIAYRIETRTVTVPAGGEVVADFTLAPSALSLDEMVITATGSEQSAREVPSAISKIDLGDIVSVAPISDFTDALQARVAGVTVIPSSGTTGAGTRIRIRGSGSVSLSNEPVIYIDGVRVESGASSNSIGVGGQVPSRLNDIDPEEIQSVEIIKGPAAAALYGTDAANGIISITTKRGSPGSAQWRAYYETGTVRNYVRFPDNVFGFDATKASNSVYRYGCTLVRQSQGLCAQTGLFLLNPLMNDSPFRHGNHGQYGVSVSGGAERLTYFLSGDITNEQGVYANNKVDRVNLRANLTAALSPILDVGIQSGYVHSNLQLPDNDNDALGYLGSGMLGNSDTTRHGWGFLLPSQVAAINTRQSLERFTSGASADLRPFSWLTMHGVAGLDYTTRFDTRTIQPNQVPFNTATLQGSRIADPIQIWDWNAKASAQAKFSLPWSLTSQTTVGVDFFHSRVESIFASGQKLAGGTSSLAGIGIPSVSEDVTESRTLGSYVEEQVGWHNRVYVTGSVRRDDNSAFGKNFNSVTYPKIGASWMLSEERFFPRNPVVSTLRLRAAYGILGLAPGATDALQYFNPVAVTDQSGDQVAFTVGSLGNPDLKPERDHETEVGFDLGLFRDRLNAVFTYYNKDSRDALISRILAPSLGVSTSQFYNLGQVSNKGWEFDLNGRLLGTRDIAVDVDVSAWHNTNKLVDLGHDALGNPIPTIVFTPQQHKVGYPLGSYFVKKITSFSDANGDGIITSNEVTLDTAFSFVGPSQPTKGWGFSPTVTLFQKVRIGATFDHRGGNYLYNLTAEFRCRQGNCAELNDPKTPLARQAQAVSTVYLGQPNGYIEPADFTKLRELSITFIAPESWARAVKARGLSITVAGRNLHTWTKYSGLDPELNEAGQANFTSIDFLTQPPVRYYTARVNLNF